MALTKEDLQAIRALMESEREYTSQMIDTKLTTALEPVNARLDTMQADIDQIKEDTAITREAVNSLGEWVEVASDVLKIGYPVERIE